MINPWLPWFNYNMFFGGGVGVREMLLLNNNMHTLCAHRSVYRG